MAGPGAEPGPGAGGRAAVLLLGTMGACCAWSPGGAGNSHAPALGTWLPKPGQLGPDKVPASPALPCGWKIQRGREGRLSWETMNSWVHCHLLQEEGDIWRLLRPQLYVTHMRAHVAPRPLSI